MDANQLLDAYRNNPEKLRQLLVESEQLKESVANLQKEKEQVLQQKIQVEQETSSKVDAFKKVYADQNKATTETFLKNALEAFGVSSINDLPDDLKQFGSFAGSDPNGKNILKVMEAYNNTESAKKKMEQTLIEQEKSISEMAKKMAEAEKKIMEFDEKNKKRAREPTADEQASKKPKNSVGNSFNVNQPMSRNTTGNDFNDRYPKIANSPLEIAVQNSKNGGLNFMTAEQRRRMENGEDDDDSPQETEMMRALKQRLAQPYSHKEPIFASGTFGNDRLREVVTDYKNEKNASSSSSSSDGNPYRY